MDYIILSFSVDNWFGPRMGRHNLMLEFSKYCPVYFCSRVWTPKESLLYILGRKKGVKCGWNKINENLTTFIPNYSFFSTYKYKKINLLQYIRYKKTIEHKINNIEYDFIILYIWHPAFAWVPDTFFADMIIYHMYDDYSSYSDMTPVQKREILDQEMAIISKSDLVFATHPALLKKEYGIGSKGRVIGNAVDFDLFSQKCPVADEISVLHKKYGEEKIFVGYVGRITSKLDFCLMNKLVENVQNLVLILVGPVSSITQEDRFFLERLSSYENVHLMGEKKINALPGYINGLDVAILPYKIDGAAHIHAIYPLKLHEYFACGKPVLATCFNSYMQDIFPDQLIWGDIDKWIETLTNKYKFKSLLQGKRLRIRTAEENSWKHRVLEIQRYIRNIRGNHENM